MSKYEVKMRRVFLDEIDLVTKYQAYYDLITATRGNRRAEIHDYPKWRNRTDVLLQYRTDDYPESWEQEGWRHTFDEYEKARRFAESWLG